jgi:hypothetical protein
MSKQTIRCRVCGAPFTTQIRNGWDDEDEDNFCEYPSCDCEINVSLHPRKKKSRKQRDLEKPIRNAKWPFCSYKFERHYDDSENNAIIPARKIIRRELKRCRTKTQSFSDI